MMKKKLSLVVGTLAVATVAVVPLVAHHAFGGEFDSNRPVLLRGPDDRLAFLHTGPRSAPANLRRT